MYIAGSSLEGPASYQPEPNIDVILHNYPGMLRLGFARKRIHPRVVNPGAFLGSNRGNLFVDREAVGTLYIVGAESDEGRDRRVRKHRVRVGDEDVPLPVDALRRVVVVNRGLEAIGVIAVDGALDECLGVGGGLGLGRKLVGTDAEQEAGVPMFALTYGFGLVAMDALVDPDVLVVAQAGFDECRSAPHSSSATVRVPWRHSIATSETTATTANARRLMSNLLLQRSLAHFSKIASLALT